MMIGTNRRNGRAHKEESHSTDGKNTNLFQKCTSSSSNQVLPSGGDQKSNPIKTKMGESNTSTVTTQHDAIFLSAEKIKELSVQVQKVVYQKFQNKTMGEFAIKRLQLFPKLDHNEIQYGKHLGNGQFGIVFEIRDITLSNTNQTNTAIKTTMKDCCDNHEEAEIKCKEAAARNGDVRVKDCNDEDTDEQDRKFLEAHCQRKNMEDGNMFGRYAIKKLRANDRYNEKSYYCGVMDLAVEAHILAGLEHPHIVKLRGLSRDADLGTSNFFIIMDRLVCTLKDKLVQWKKYQRRHFHLHDYFYYQRKNNSNEDGIVTTSLSDYKGLTAGNIFHHYMKSINYNYNKMSTNNNNNNSKLMFLQERLTAMKALSSAVLYLHNHCIIDRDIKPDNIGFDVRGDIKLFDFGISTISDPHESKPFYHLTSKAGTLRYMAPEVYDVNRPYDESADIYSLSLVFWQMLSLEPLYPFKVSSSKEFCELVFKGQTRPELNNKKWSNELKALLSSMWDHNPTKRPTAKKVNLKLQRELASIKSASYNNNANSSNNSRVKASLYAPPRMNNACDSNEATKSSKNKMLKKLSRHRAKNGNHSNIQGQTSIKKDNVNVTTLCGDNIGNTILSSFTEDEFCYDNNNHDNDHQLLFVPHRNSTFIQRRFVTADDDT